LSVHRSCKTNRAVRLIMGAALCQLLSLSCLSAVEANIPAAYLACEGAELREDCVMTGPQYGVCLRDTLCEDPPETEVNECVLCVDACWGQEEGSSCVRPWTGEVGICEAQDQCTDREETSFQECMRCVEPPPSSAQAEEGCVSYSPSSHARLSSLFSLIFAAFTALLIRRLRAQS
jgi:hypothetical protein